MKIISAFAVPFVQFKMENSEALCEALRVLFLEKEAAGDVFRNRTARDTQQGPLYESRFDLYDWPEEPIQQMRDYVHGGLNQAIQHLSSYSDAEMANLDFEYHSWFHVTRKGGFQGMHNHANASWSGIFCVDPGDPVPDRPDSGVVYLHDPRAGAWNHLDAGNSRMDMPHAHGAFKVQHKAGGLTLFPSYIWHEIFPYLGSRPRIIAPFNCWVTARN